MNKILFTILILSLSIPAMAQRKVVLGGNVTIMDAAHQTTHALRTFVTYNKTGYGGRKNFYVYTEYADYPDHFIGFQIGNDYSTSHETYSNQFRIVQALPYVYSGGTMTAEGGYILQTGDCEGVFLQEGKKDFTGGFHDDETYNNVQFYINDDTLTAAQLTTNFTLTQCDSFKMVQQSNIHETANTGEATDTTHPIIAQKLKHVLISNSGYMSRTRYDWQDTVEIEMMYHGIVTIDTSNADYVYTETDTTKHYTVHDNGFPIDVHDGTRTVYYENPTRGRGAIVTSYIITPSGQDSGALLWVWDTPKYAKYYRKNYSNYTVYPADVSEGYQVITFSRQ